VSDGSSKQRWVLGALALVVVLLVGLTWRGLRGGPAPGQTSTPGERAAGSTSAVPASAPAGAGIPEALTVETPPWQATPHGTAVLPAGTVPVSDIDPPPPDPSLPMPPDPVEPPNPAESVPPLHNPGGVNSDRPERPTPGL
jgi:hypothetical protein